MSILEKPTEILLSRSTTHRQGMIWVEVTNGCNLNCGHCYSDSFPGSNVRDKLTHDDYLRIVDEASDLGMSTIQFIGGEPLLYKRLPELIERAQAAGFENVEIFSNLTADRPDVFGVADPAKTSFATSVYSFDAAIHDMIVQRIGSFSRTVANIRTLIERGVQVRAGFIEMELNQGQYDQTARYLREIGVCSVGFDRVRKFGRGGEATEPCMSQLCGSCAGNTLCVTYEGKVLPCIMSRSWPLGSIFSHSLREIARQDATSTVRDQIFEATATKRNMADARYRAEQCYPAGCPPYGSCDPCGPNHPTNPNCRPHNGLTPAPHDHGAVAVHEHMSEGLSVSGNRCDPLGSCDPLQSCYPNCSPNASQPCSPNQWCDPSRRTW